MSEYIQRKNHPKHQRVWSIASFSLINVHVNPLDHAGIYAIFVEVA